MRKLLRAKCYKRPPATVAGSPFRRGAGPIKKEESLDHFNDPGPLHRQNETGETVLTAFTKKAAREKEKKREDKKRKEKRKTKRKKSKKDR